MEGIAILYVHGLKVNYSNVFPWNVAGKILVYFFRGFFFGQGRMFCLLQTCEEVKYLLSESSPSLNFSVNNIFANHGPSDPLRVRTGDSSMSDYLALKILTTIKLLFCNILNKHDAF